MTPPTSSPLHPLLLLSDSALPLGSFAFSSGLESFLAHTKTPTPNRQSKITSPTPLQKFTSFLQHSLQNMASTSLPYVRAGYQCTTLEALEDLDNDFDASTPCTVARRASVSQGRAMVGVWERALASSAPPDSAAAAGVMDEFAAALKATATKGAEAHGSGLGLNAHFPPLFGVVCAAMGLTERDTAYLFLLNHAKAVLSAGVRASVMGPYQSHALLASAEMQAWVPECVERELRKGVEDAGVSVPVMDIWMGRHELLYSRIFNS